MLTKKMRKGVHPIIPFVIVLGLFLALEYFYVSYFIREEFIAGRYLRETPILAEADKLETYVRSFKGAVELSFLQATYDNKDQTSSFWYNYGLKLREDEFLKKIASKTRDSLSAYLEEYKNFIQNYREEILIEDKLANEETGWDENQIYISFDPLAFEVKKKAVEISRKFEPEARVRSRIKRIWMKSLDLIKILTEKIIELGGKNDKKGELGETDCDQATANKKIISILDNLKGAWNKDSWLENIPMDYILLETKFEKMYKPEGFKCCQINVSLILDSNDTNFPYPVFDKGLSSVKEDFLGLRLKGRTGNALDCYYVPYCLDLDSTLGKVEYYTYSKIKYDGKELEDYCSSDDTLVEMTCVGTKPSQKIYSCLSGCLNGKCIAYDGYNHKCMEITLEKQSNLTVIADFKSVNDPNEREFIVSLNCSESEGKRWYPPRKSECSSDGCSYGEYCRMGKGYGGIYSYRFINLLPGPYKICLWPTSESGYLWNIRSTYEITPTAWCGPGSLFSPSEWSYGGGEVSPFAHLWEVGNCYVEVRMWGRDGSDKSGVQFRDLEQEAGWDIRECMDDCDSDCDQDTDLDLGAEVWIEDVSEFKKIFKLRFKTFGKEADNSVCGGFAIKVFGDFCSFDDGTKDWKYYTDLICDKPYALTDVYSFGIVYSPP